MAPGKAGDEGGASGGLAEALGEPCWGSCGRARGAPDRRAAFMSLAPVCKQKTRGVGLRDR